MADIRRERACTKRGGLTEVSLAGLQLQVEELPRIAFAAVDYENTQLGKEQFDITILNECEQMEETKKIVEEAIRVTKPGGKIICLANRQPLLEAMFKLLLPKHEVYFPNEEIKILVAERRE